jgi:YbbR domain-containing protein
MSMKRNWSGFAKEFAKDYLLENTGLKVLALLITGVLWLSVASRPVNEITLTSVPIEIQNLPESPHLIVSEYETLTARVSLRGPRDVLDSLRPHDLTVIADMSNVEPGVRVIQLRLDRNRLPTSAQEQSIEPRSIRLTVERVVEREVPVKPRLDGEPPPGYEMSWVVVPSTVVITGAASQVRQIDHVSTETVSLTDQTASFTESVVIDTASPNVTVLNDSDSTVELHVYIKELHKERVFEHVPVVLAGGPPSARPEPRFVTVVLYGPRSLIDSIGPGDVSVTIEYGKDPGNQVEVAPQVKVAKDPGRVTVRNVEPASVRIRAR